MLQYHGNDLDALRDQLCELLRTQPLAPLARERIIVPNVGMERWLRQGIATRLGIAANLECSTPAVFVNALGARAAAPGGGTSGWSKERAELRLLRVIPSLHAHPDAAQLMHYLDGPTPQLRLLRLARRLAALFDQYLLFRPDWLDAWEHGTDAPGCPAAQQPWQAPLWRALLAAMRDGGAPDAYGAARTHALVAWLRDPAHVPELPPRVIAFAPGTLPPAVLAVLDTLSAAVPLHYFHFNPCRDFWGDIVTERTRARWSVRAPARAELSHTGNALLASLGTTARDNLQQLLELGHVDIEDAFVAPVGDTVLAHIQRDILDLGEPARPRPLAAGDHSFCFAAAHSPQREIEALHDHLLHLFETLPGLAPRDIVVMAPDIGAYANAIDAVFRAGATTVPHLPATIADRSALDESATLRAVLHLLKLPDSRFGASETGALLAVPAIAAHFGFDADALGEVRRWIAASGIRLGYDASASAGSGPALARNTWRFGLDRLLLGIALDGDSVFDGTTPLAIEGSDAIERLGRLAEFVDRLAHHARALQAPRPLHGWVAAVNALLADFFGPDTGDDAELARFGQALAALAADMAAANVTEALTREVLVDLLGERLGSGGGAHRFLRGGINFCQLTPLRSIPFRVVCLLGLDADAFPRNTQAPAFDLMATARRPNDPSRRGDDRLLFLECLLSARDQLYISHVGHDERSNAEREPALPVLELRAYIDRHWQAAGHASVAAALSVSHRLKPFHRDYFSPGGTLFSYRREWLPPAGGNDAAPAFCPGPLPPGTTDTVTLNELVQFFRYPCRGFFEQRLGVYFREAEVPEADREPFALDALDSFQLRQRLVLSAQAGQDQAAAGRQLLGSGVLPLGAAANGILAREQALIAPLVGSLAAWQDLAPRSEALDIALPSGRLSGTLGDLRGDGLKTWHAGRHAGGRQLLAFWIRHLCACAAGVAAAPSELFCIDSCYRLAALTADSARAELDALLAIRASGLRQPLPLFADCAAEWVLRWRSKNDASAALEAARRAFEGGQDHPGEGSTPAVRRAFPDADAALGDAFVTLARRLFEPLLDALTEDAHAAP